MASLASRREFLNLDRWLADSVKVQGRPFLNACLEFLDMKARKEVAHLTEAPKSGDDTIALQPLRIAAFLRVLRAK